MPSLALIFHLISVVDGAVEAAGGVSAEAALRATAWCEYLETHARRLYASAEDTALEGARALLGRIRKGDVQDGCTVREIHRGHEWSRLSTTEEVSAAVAVLEDHDWLRVEKVATGGVPSSSYTCTQCCLKAGGRRSKPSRCSGQRTCKTCKSPLTLLLHVSHVSQPRDSAYTKLL